MAVISAALLVPAAAQFWNPFSAIQRPPQRAPQQQQPQYNPFGTLFGSPPDPRRTTQPKADNTHAPPPPRRSPEAAAAITSPILVLGDSMADWLAFGLENAFAERPEFGIVRRHRSYAGLVRYDPRRDVEWPQIVREAIAAEKPKFVVMMVGFHDRQQIRERTPAANPPRSAAPPAPPADDPKSHADPDSPEARARASADAQNAELRKSQRAPPAGSESPTAAPTGPLEFQSEAWQAAYIRRIDATIAALNSASVPVFWVGLPPQRLARQSADAVYLNELYRGRAERVGITYVDIWDGFVDEAGRYVVQGPDFEGQTRRLRSADGLYFTLAGARKLAHYVEREILRSLVSRQTPVALPLPEPTLPQPGRPGATRPLVGAVIPLTASIGGGNELLGGSPSRPTAADPLASRVMVRGEPITAPVGRADNFAWPRGGAATVNEGEVPETQAPVAVTQPTAKPPAPQAAPPIAPPASPPRPPARTAAQPPAGVGAPPASPQYSAPRPKQQAPIQLLPGSEPKQPVQRRAPPPRISNDGVPRPLLSIGR